jgi:Putative Flp pilus-assembly TadE/G-like
VIRRPLGERGSTLPIVSLMLVVLIGFAALAVDVGFWFTDKRAAQNGADAAALAGAQSLRPDVPSTWPGARAIAVSYLGKNALDASAADILNVTLDAPNDSVYVEARRPSRSFFSGVFGVGAPTTRATATATVRSARGCGVKSCPIVPWGVPDCAQDATGTLDCSRPLSSSVGRSVTLKAPNGSTGNFFALRVPNFTGSGCDLAPNGGGSLYRREIAGPYGGNGTTSCGLWSVDAGTNACNAPTGSTCTVDTLTGNSVGPTLQGVGDRICTTASSCNDDTLATVVGSCDVSTTRCPILADSPRLMVAPIVRNLDGSVGYQNGRQTVEIVDFAYFFVTTPGNQLNGQTVTGVFFYGSAPPWLDLGAFNGGIAGVQLTR